MRFSASFGIFFVFGSLVACPVQSQPMAATMAAVPQQFASLGDLKLENGATIRDCKLGYRTLGALNETRSNAILIPTWFAGKSEEAVGMLGPRGLFDPAPYFVVVVDAIGNGVSCSPSNSISQHGSVFPAFSVRDMVQSQYQLLTQKLGILHLHAIVGFSMGGMQTFQWMVSHPDFMDVAIPIAGTSRQSSYDQLFWRTGESAILSDPDYANGNYLKNPKLPTFNLLFNMQVLTPAFRVAHTKPEDFENFYQKVSSDPDAPDANDIRWQIRAMLAQDIGIPSSSGAGGGRSLELAAKQVHARVHIVNARQDHVVNPAAALEFASLVHADVTILEGDCGHTAVSCEMPRVHAAVKSALR